MIIENNDTNTAISRILILSATEKELKPTLDFVNQDPVLLIQKLTNIGISIKLSTIGVGGASAIFNAYELIQQADLVILVGVAGSFQTSIQLGEVIQVVSDEFADLGVNDRGVFRSVFEIGLTNANEFPFNNGKIPASTFLNIHDLKTVEGITVNTVSGDEVGISKLIKAYPHATIETMEGAYIHYLAAMFHKKLLHIRGISNYVEPRNRANWKLDEAIVACNEYIVKVLNNLSLF